MWDASYGYRRQQQAAELADAKSQEALSAQTEAAACITSLKVKRAGLDNWWDREQVDEEIQQAELRAFNARRSAIVNSMWATGRMQSMAQHLADDTDMSTDDAIATLRIAGRTSLLSTMPTVAERVGSASDALALGGVMSRGDANSLASGHSSWGDRTATAKIYEARKRQTKKGNSR